PPAKQLPASDSRPRSKPPSARSAGSILGGDPGGSSTSSAVGALTRCRLDPGIYRCLRRHGLIELRRRRKRRDEYRRWERERPMQLWQMDVMGGVLLEDGTELKVVTGVEDHSRFLRGSGPGD